MANEKRLIDANALSVKVLDASYWDNQDEDVIWNLVQDAPTIDAVPVVRCKDCKWCDDFDVNGIGLCWENKKYVNGDDFCSDGERREGE